VLTSGRARRASIALTSALSALLAFGLIGLPCAAAAEDAPPSGDHVYRQMVEAMRAAPEPSTVRCALDVNSTWMEFDFANRDGGLTVSFGIPGDTAARRFLIGSDARTSTGYAERVDGRGVPLAAPISGPAGTRGPYPVTLAQVFRFVRTYGSGESPAASPSPSAAPANAPGTSEGSSADADPQLIGRVVAFTDFNYDVTNLGRESFEGHDVYHLHFAARREPRDHPLTDALVDTTTLLPRRLQADIQVSTAPAVHFAFTFDFDRSGDYWIARTSHVRSRIQLAFVRKSGTVDLRVVDEAFNEPFAVPGAPAGAPAGAPSGATPR
jgi:hypothetical protein